MEEKEVGNKLVADVFSNLTNEEKEKIAKFDELLKDADFLKRLKTSPEPVLLELGFELPEKAQVVVIDNDDAASTEQIGEDTIVIDLRHPSVDGYLDQDDYKNVAAGIDTAAIIGISVAGLAVIGAGILGAKAAYGKYKNSATYFRRKGAMLDYKEDMHTNIPQAPKLDLNAIKKFN